MSGSFSPLLHAGHKTLEADTHVDSYDNVLSDAGSTPAASTIQLCPVSDLRTWFDGFGSNSMGRPFRYCESESESLPPEPLGHAAVMAALTPKLPAIMTFAKNDRRSTRLVVISASVSAYLESAQFFCARSASLVGFVFIFITDQILAFRV